MRANYLILGCIAILLCIGCNTPQKKTDKQVLDKELVPPDLVTEVTTEQPQSDMGDDAPGVDIPVSNNYNKFEEKLAEDKRRTGYEDYLLKNYLTTAKNQAQQGKYESAYEYVVEALKIDDKHPEALALKKAYGHKLGFRPDEIEEHTRKSVDRVKVRIEQARLEINNRIAKGKRLLKQKEYKAAITLFKQAKENLRWLPYHVREIEGRSRQVDFLIQRAEEEYAKYEQELKRKRMIEAQEQAKREEIARLNTLREQVRNLNRQANLAFEQEKYDLAENFCRQIARIDPDNKDVEQLIELIRVARHAKIDDITRNKYLEQWNVIFQQIDQGMVYQADVVVYPDYEEWKRISRRGSKGIQEKIQEETPQVRLVKERLEDVMSMDFSESPLSEVIDFIRNRTGINVIIDPVVYRDFPDAEALKVDITVTDLKLHSILNIILETKGLTYHIRDGGVLVVSTKKRVQAKPFLKLYNVRDLTGKLTDFPAPELNISAAGNEAGGGAILTDDEARPVTTITEEELTDLIKNNIAKASWDEEKRSIDARHGTLIIRQIKVVHEQIESLLNDLRKATGLLVTIETRFINVEDDFLEDVGVDWRSLGAVAETNAPETDTDALPAEYTGTGMPYRPMDDLIFGDEVGTDSVAGMYWREESNLETSQRVENLFDDTLGESTVGEFTNTGGLSFQFSYLDDIELQGILRAVRKRSRSSLLTAPLLTLFNTQRGNVSILTQKAYVKDYDVEIATNATIADPQIGTVQEGVVLDVRPIISADRKYITLELQPAVAVVVDNPRVPTQLASSAASGPGVVFINLPIIELSRLKTTVTIPDRGTMLLGGVIEARREDYTSGIPILSDLPLINFFFHRKGQSYGRQCLLILVTAKITSLEEHEPKEGLRQ